MSQDKKTELEKKLQEYAGIQQGPPETGADAVNEAMIRHWAQALGDRNPAYTDPVAAKDSVHGGIVAPPTLLQAWILPGHEMAQPSEGPKDKQGELHALLSEHGYTGVVATDCEQDYRRYLRQHRRDHSTALARGTTNWLPQRSYRVFQPTCGL